MNQPLPIPTDIRLFELQENLFYDQADGAEAIELFYNGNIWLPSGSLRIIYDPTNSVLMPALTRVYCIFNQHVQQWHPIAVGDGSFWVKLTDRCERAYSGVRVIPKTMEWPITEWAQAADPRLFDEDPYFLFDRNIFDVNGAAPNVQGGIQPLVTRCWPGGTLDIDDIEDQACLPQAIQDYLEAETSSSSLLVPKYLVDFKIPNEADSERHNLYD